MNKFFLSIIIIFVIAVSLSAQDSEMMKIAPLISAKPDSLLDESYIFRKKPNIAILPFTNANTYAKEAEFGRMVSSMLSTALRNKTNFVVLERSELQGILTEKALENSGLTKDKTMQLGDLYNVEVILVGDVSLIDHTLHIDARLIETKSSQVAVALYGTCQDLSQIRVVMEKLADELEQKYLRQWMGSISILSEPVGAEVYLEGAFIGLTAALIPLKEPDLLEGTYHLKLILGGYYDWEGDIAVLSKMERTVKVSLIAKPGSMNIYSEPVGAQIYLDNNPMGLTPMSLKKVAEGEHEIRLVRKNYKEWNRKVTVRSFQPTDVKATLEVSPGMLTVKTDPDKAHIYLKGLFVADSPHTLSNIPPGEIVIRVEKEGYEEWTTSVLIQPNQHEILDVFLKEKIGTLSVTSRPEGAEVFIAKPAVEPNKIGETPILNYIQPIGNYMVEVKKIDYEDNMQRILIEHEKLTEVKFELKEKPGTIMVNTNPTNARIFFDGIYKGRSPFLIQNVKKGDYLVSIQLPYAEETQRVNVEPNRQAFVDASFKKSNRYVFGITAIGITGILFNLMAE